MLQSVAFGDSVLHMYVHVCVCLGRVGVAGRVGIAMRCSVLQCIADVFANLCVSWEAARGPYECRRAHT